MPAPGEPLPRDFPDRAIRDALPRPDHLRAVLRRTFPDLADRLDYARAQLVDRQFLVDDWRRREADVLVRIPLLGREGESVLVCVLIEHQSSADQATPLRLLLHAVLFWEKEWHDWQEGHPRGQPLRLTPILPVIFHTGPEQWSTNRSVADLFAGPAELHALAPQWPAKLWDLAEHSPAELLQAEEVWWQAMAIVRADRAETAEFLTVLRQALARIEPLGERDRMTWEHLLKIVLSWGLFRRPRSEHEAVVAAVRSSHGNVTMQQEVQAMTQQLEQTWEQELAFRFEARGKLEAHRDILRSQLEERFQVLPEELRQRIAAAELPALQAALKRVPSLQSLEELAL